MPETIVREFELRRASDVANPVDCEIATERAFPRRAELQPGDRSVAQGDESSGRCVSFRFRNAHELALKVNVLPLLRVNFRTTESAEAGDHERPQILGMLFANEFEQATEGSSRRSRR
jgi:hypothetical protein